MLLEKSHKIKYLQKNIQRLKNEKKSPKNPKNSASCFFDIVNHEKERGQN